MEQKYLDFVIKFVDYYVNEDGTILGYEKEKYSTDDLSESRVLFDLYKYLLYFDEEPPEVRFTLLAIFALRFYIYTYNIILQNK